ncbi:class I SAM-dependent methyltransferase [Sporomusa aerivorans]|uniref:class I SAM-dependent methyltransferase n=1 Tax=Sporomusa aerivorans TaxID=204936 RepID=UPI00352A1DF1
MQKLEAIRDYWTLRADGFSAGNQDELNGEARIAWRDVLRKNVPAGENLKCLDIGCGPGFLSILLAECGYEVTAVDYTEKMLERARENAAAEGAAIRFLRMDAQSMDFPDNSFDFIVSRNLVWNLEEPERAYLEWLRILKPEGRLVIFDGNHYLYQFNQDYLEERRAEGYQDGHKAEYIQGVSTAIMGEIARELPLSRLERPQWDLNFLIGAGVKRVCADLVRKEFLTSEKVKKSIVKSFTICADK